MEEAAGGGRSTTGQEPTSNGAAHDGDHGVPALRLSQEPQQPRHVTRPAACAVVALATLLTAASASVLGVAPSTGASTEDGAGAAAASSTAATPPGSPGGGDAVSRPPVDASTGGPAVTGVLLVLDKEMSGLLASGGFNDVMSMMAGSLEAAAGACGATVDGIDIAGGGLLVRLDDPSLNPCFIDGLAGIEHVVSADEDMAMTAQ